MAGTQTIHLRTWNAFRAVPACKRKGVATSSPNAAKVTCLHCRALLRA